VVCSRRLPGLTGLLDLGPAVAQGHGAIENRVLRGRLIVADEVPEPFKLVSDGVIDSPNSIVVEQAYNREVTAQAVLKMILEG